MKLIMLTFLLTIVACNKQKIQVGDCIQKPDSPIIWSVESVTESEVTITNQTTKQEIAVVESLNNNWGIVNCLY